MLNNLNFGIKPTNTSKDSVIAKNIINKLFVFVDSCIRNDREMNTIVKGIALKQLPGIAKGSREYVDKMDSLNIKKLLDDIQYEISTRK